jgi:hypothetical protein
MFSHGTYAIIKKNVEWGICMNSRNIKFQYFKIVRQKREKDFWRGIGLFEVLVWLDNVKRNSLLREPIELEDTKAQIEKIDYSEKENVWIMRFMKLREDNIPSIAKKKQEAKGIELGEDEYIGEDVYVLYDAACGIAMIQANRFSLGLKRLSELMSKVWGRENERIAIRPIAQNFDLNNNRRAYRTLELSFANIDTPETDDKSSLNRIMSCYNRFYGVSGTIKISVGRTKGGTLNIDEVENIIEDIRSDKSVVGAKIRIKDDDKTYVETVDLFDNVYNDVIEFKMKEKSVLDPEYVAINMIKYYKDRRQELIKNVGTGKS